jgi:arylsulfatase A-like enzyme
MSLPRARREYADATSAHDASADARRLTNDLTERQRTWRTPVAAARACLFALLVAAPVSLPLRAAAEPLRRTTVPLIAAFADAVISPPLPARRKLAGCAPGTSHDAWQNPFSDLPPELASRNLRFTWTESKGVISQRDVFVLEAGHAVSFDVVPERDPRLELGWRILRCGERPRSGLVLEVTVADAHGAVTQALPLESGALRALARASERDRGEAPRRKRTKQGEAAPPERKRRDDPGFVPLTVDLPLEPDEPARITLRLVDPDEDPERPRKRRSLESALVVGLAEPALTGVPADGPPIPRSAREDLEHPPAVGADVNVLWVVIDAVRRDALGPGRTFDAPQATPHLDQIFAEGTSFREAWSLGNSTRTSTVAMLASAPPSLGGVHSHSWSFTTGRLETFYASRPPLITRLLERYGWRVAHFGHNLFVFGGESIGVDHGFPRVADFKAIPADAVKASEHAVAFMTEHRARRWALMLNYTAPHTPYRPPEAFQEKADALPGPERLGGVLPRSYFGELMWVDHNLGPVFASLDALGLREKTLVIVTADHGELMDPRHACFSGIVGQPCAFNHSLTVYGGELRVPLALRLPGRTQPGQVVDVPVSHLDLAPTILDLLELPPAPRHAGRSLRPALEGAPLAPRPLIADGRLATAFRDGPWKLIVHAPSDDVAPLPRKVAGSPRDLAPHELFNLETDPNEHVNVAYVDRAATDRMLERLRDFRLELAGRVAGRRSADEVVAASEGVARPPWALRVVVAAGRAAPSSLTLSLGMRASAPSQLAAQLATPTCPALAPRSAGGEASCVVGADGVARVTLTAPAGDHAELTLTLPGAERAPSEASLAWDLSLDGRPLSPGALRLGPLGLAFFARTPTPALAVWLDAARASGAGLPVMAPDEAAVHVLTRPLAEVRHGGSERTSPEVVLDLPEAGPADPDADKRLGRDVRRVLRELGYSR